MSLAQSINSDLQEAGAHDPELEHVGECLPGAWCGSTSLGRSLSQVRKVGVAVGSVCGPPTDPKVRLYLVTPLLFTPGYAMGSWFVFDAKIAAGNLFLYFTTK